MGVYGIGVFVTGIEVIRSDKRNPLNPIAFDDL